MATSVGFRADVYPTVFSSYGLTWSLLSDARTRASFAFQSHYVLRNSVVIPEADLAGRRVDIMPWDIVDAYVYSLTWDPRPVMQSYAAFTPYLDGRDAEFFNGTAAPDRILYILESIDTRYQAFDEPATFRVLLERYWAYNEVSNDALVLSRRASPLSGTVRSEGRQCVDVGSSIAIPQIPDRYVFAAVSVHLSIFGQLKTWVFKPGWLTITLDVPGELTSPHRFVSAVGLDGLFVSSSMDTAQDVTAAFRGKFTKPIKALTVDSTDRGDYNTTVCADFTSIPAPVGS